MTRDSGRASSPGRQRGGARGTHCRDVGAVHDGLCCPRLGVHQGDQREVRGDAQPGVAGEYRDQLDPEGMPVRMGGHRKQPPGVRNNELATGGCEGLAVGAQGPKPRGQHLQELIQVEQLFDFTLFDQRYLHWRVAPDSGAPNGGAMSPSWTIRYVFRPAVLAARNLPAWRTKGSTRARVDGNPSRTHDRVGTYDRSGGNACWTTSCGCAAYCGGPIPTGMSAPPMYGRGAISTYEFGAGAMGVHTDELGVETVVVVPADDAGGWLRDPLLAISCQRR